MSFKIPDNHFFYESAGAIHELIEPLRKKGVTSFVYVDARLDGSEIRLSNQPKWLAHYYQSQYYLQSGFEKNPTCYRSGIAIWSYLSHHQPILEAAAKFNIAHGFTLIQKKREGCEFYFIGTSRDQAFLGNHLLSQIDQIKQDILNFQDKGKSLIKEANKRSILIPNKYQNNVSSERGILFDSRKSDFSSINPWEKCSPREIQCAKLWERGFSARQIANQLHLSSRTVENHFQNLKIKLNVKNKFELIQLTREYFI